MPQFNFNAEARREEKVDFSPRPSVSLSPAIPAGTYLTNNRKLGDCVFVKYLENITTEIAEITESLSKFTLCYLGDLPSKLFVSRLECV